MKNQSQPLGEQMIEFIPALRRYARVLAGSGDRADDLVQDCIERALSRASLYQADTNLRAWLFTIMRNIAITQVRRDKLRSSYAVELEAMVQRAVAPSQTDTIALKDSLGLLDLLSSSERQAVELLAIQDLSYEEAAKITGLPTGTLKSRLSRCRKHLHDMTHQGEALSDPTP